jgi:DNA-binding response OmpR family regulator
MLPDTDGFELCRNIRQNTVLRKVPIIILSARTTAMERKQALESGANDYVTKPFSPQDLISRVKDSCGNEGLHLVAGLVAVPWADGSHDTAAYAEPHYPKQAQHQSEA